MATAEEIASGQRIRALITAALGSAVWEGGGGAGTPAAQLDADGTVLDVNTIADGEFLKRVGLTVVGAAAGGGGGGDIDGGAPDSIYGGTTDIDGGPP